MFKRNSAPFVNLKRTGAIFFNIDEDKAVPFRIYVVILKLLFLDTWSKATGFDRRISIINASIGIAKFSGFFATFNLRHTRVITWNSVDTNSREKKNEVLCYSFCYPTVRTRLSNSFHTNTLRISEKQYLYRPNYIQNRIKEKLL